MCLNYRYYVVGTRPLEDVVYTARAVVVLILRLTLVLVVAALAVADDVEAVVVLILVNRTEMCMYKAMCYDTYIFSGG